MRETFSALIAHCGGADTVSEPQRMVARRIATLEAVLVYLEDDFATAYAENATRRTRPCWRCTAPWRIGSDA